MSKRTDKIIDQLEEQFETTPLVELFNGEDGGSFCWEYVGPVSVIDLNALEGLPSIRLDHDAEGDSDPWEMPFLEEVFAERFASESGRFGEFASNCFRITIERLDDEQG